MKITPLHLYRAAVLGLLSAILYVCVYAAGQTAYCYDRTAALPDISARLAALERATPPRPPNPFADLRAGKSPSAVVESMARASAASEAAPQ